MMSSVTPVLTGSVTSAFATIPPDASRNSAGTNRRQNLDSLLDLGHRPDMKSSRGHRLQHILAQHQILDVGLRHQHALRARQTLDAAHIKESFNLFVDSADRLDISLLVHRPGHGNVLPQRNS